MDHFHRRSPAASPFPRRFICRPRVDPQPLSLTPEQIDLLFPFHLRIDRRGIMHRASSALLRVCPELVLGGRWNEHFELQRPNLPGATFEEVLERVSTGENCVMSMRGPELQLTGQLLELSGEQVLFVGRPHLQGLDDLRAVGLRQSDFPPHDPLHDYLVLLQSKSRALEDMREAAERFAMRNQELDDWGQSQALVSREVAAFLELVTIESTSRLDRLRGTVEGVDASKLTADGLNAMRLVGDGLAEFGSVLRHARHLASIEAGRAKLIGEEFSPIELARSIVAAVQPVASHRQIKLDLWIDPELPARTYGPHRTLGRLLSKILRRVIACSDGQHAQLRFAVDEDRGADHGLQVEVFDRTGGVPEAIAQVLCDPLTELEPPNFESGAVCDVELAVARSLLRLVGGEISLQADAMGPTRLFMRMPWANERCLRDSLEQSFPERVLLIGDRASRDLLEIRGQLDRARVQVRWVNTRSAAAMSLREQSGIRAFDAVIVMLSENNRNDWRDRLRRLLLGTPRPHPRTLGLHPKEARVEELQQDELQLPLGDVTLLQHLCEPVLESQQQAKRQGEPHVLVVDQDPITRRILRKVIQDLGGTCDAVADGRSALGAHESYRHELVLVDQDLPRMPGDAMVRALRTQDEDSRTKVVGFADVHPNPTYGALFSAEVDGFLAKPLRIDNARDALKNWLKRAA